MNCKSCGTSLPDGAIAVYRLGLGWQAGTLNLFDLRDRIFIQYADHNPKMPLAYPTALMGAPTWTPTPSASPTPTATATNMPNPTATATNTPTPAKRRAARPPSRLRCT